jgi:RHS repeat-associated protein
VLDKRYFYGTGVDQILAQESAGGTVSWALSDQLGTVKDWVNNGGSVANHVVYDSFGQVVSQSNAAFGSRYGFTGREFDAETGLYYYRARYYDAGVGRFIGEDPSGFNGGDANLYRYVVNSPINAIDPSGLETIIYIFDGRSASGSNPSGSAFNPFGHTAISVDGVYYNYAGPTGFYRVNEELFNRYLVPPGVRVERYRIDFTDEQEQKIIDYLDKVYKSGTPQRTTKNAVQLPNPYSLTGPYGLFADPNSDNCTTLVIDALPDSFIKQQLTRNKVYPPFALREYLRAWTRNQTLVNRFNGPIGIRSYLHENVIRLSDYYNRFVPKK